MEQERQRDVSKDPIKCATLVYGGGVCPAPGGKLYLVVYANTEMTDIKCEHCIERMVAEWRACRDMKVFEIGDDVSHHFV